MPLGSSRLLADIAVPSSLCSAGDASGDVLSRGPRPTVWFSGFGDHRAWATVVTHSKDSFSAVAAVDVACCCRWFVAMIGGRAFFFVRVVGVEGLLCRCSRRGSNQPEGMLRPGLCVHKIDTGTPVRIGTCMHACVHAHGM